MTTTFNTIIVGAGPAGLGVAIALKQLGFEDSLIVDRHGIGHSFENWPRETRFITPSFPAHEFGCPDLNAVTASFSPGAWLSAEHPTGKQYARYLRELAVRNELEVQTGIDVRGLLRHENGTIKLDTSGGALYGRTVVWAAGEFQYPNTNPFPGSELCIHSMTLASYSELKGAEFLVIGGYESGMDVASHLIAHCAKVRVLDPSVPWEETEGDPSSILSIKTRARLEGMQKTGRLILNRSAPVMEVTQIDGLYRTQTADGKQWTSATRPILANGFRGSLSLLPDAFARDERGQIQLSACDESTVMPGLFLAGPHVRHGDQLFCFIYKFRTRFPIVAAAIAEKRTYHENRYSAAAHNPNRDCLSRT